jgi:predicted nucleic acid-binding Zn ribbon protein
MARRAPRPLATALRGVLASGPQTALARVQAVWHDAVGEAVASAAEPVSERDGTVIVACRSAIWSQELSLMHDELLTRVNDALEASATGGVRALRFNALAAPPAGRRGGFDGGR